MGVVVMGPIRQSDIYIHLFLFTANYLFWRSMMDLAAYGPKEIEDIQGPILQNSVSAENVYSSSNFGQISIKKQQT
jgi:hypothetical protein